MIESTVAQRRRDFNTMAVEFIQNKIKSCKRTPNARKTWENEAKNTNCDEFMKASASNRNAFHGGFVVIADGVCVVTTDVYKTSK